MRIKPIRNSTLAPMKGERFSLDADQVGELKQAFEESRDGLLRIRYLAVRLYATGYSILEVMNITGCSRTSLMEWCRRYRRKGVAGLIDRRTGGNRAKLTAEQIEKLREKLNCFTPGEVLGSRSATPDGRFWTVEDLQGAIEAWFNVRYESRTSYLRLFDLCGFSYRRSAGVFKSKSKPRAACRPLRDR